MNEGAPLTEVQHSQIAARDQFFKVYNRISTRLKNPQDAAERALKAREVQTLISGDGESQTSLRESFFYKYKKAFGSGPAVTFYNRDHRLLGQKTNAERSCGSAAPLLSIRPVPNNRASTS